MGRGMFEMGTARKWLEWVWVSVRINVRTNAAHLRRDAARQSRLCPPPGLHLQVRPSLVGKEDGEVRSVRIPRRGPMTRDGEGGGAGAMR